MARLFISHASEDSELVNRFVDLLETGAGIDGSEVFASSVAGRGIPPGVDFRAYIREQMAGAETVVFLLTPTFYESDFCKEELGAAWVLGTPRCVMVVPPLKPDDITDVAATMQLEDLGTPQALDRVCDFLAVELGARPKIARWNAKRDEFLDWFDPGEQPQSPPPPQVQSWRDRAQWDTGVVDGTFYFHGQSMRAGLARRILRDIETERFLPMAYAFLGATGFENWSRLTADPHNRYHVDALRLFADDAHTLADAVLHTVGDTSIDLVSLGCGTGEKDRMMLRGIAAGGHASGTYYYPLDVNPSMISAALRGIVDDRTVLEGVKVKALLAEFEALPELKPVYQYREGPNMFLLLGNILGKVTDEHSFLNRLRSGATLDRDLLLIEVQNQGSDRDVEQDLASLEVQKRFDFGPLETLGVPYESEKLEYRVEPGLSTVRGTETIVARYSDCVIHGTRYSNVALTHVHRYRSDELLRTLEEVGFKPIEALDRGSSTAFLVQARS